VASRNNLGGKTQEQKQREEERRDEQEFELFLKNVPRRLNYELENEPHSSSTFAPALPGQNKSMFSAEQAGAEEEEEKECTLLAD